MMPKRKGKSHKEPPQPVKTLPLLVTSTPGPMDVFLQHMEGPLEHTGGVSGLEVLGLESSASSSSCDLMLELRLPPAPPVGELHSAISAHQDSAAGNDWHMEGGRSAELAVAEESGAFSSPLALEGIILWKEVEEVIRHVSPSQSAGGSSASAEPVAGFSLAAPLVFSLERPAKFTLESIWMPITSLRRVLVQQINGLGTPVHSNFQIYSANTREISAVKNLMGNL